MIVVKGKGTIQSKLEWLEELPDEEQSLRTEGIKARLSLQLQVREEELIIEDNPYKDTTEYLEGVEEAERWLMEREYILLHKLD